MQLIKDVPYTLKRSKRKTLSIYVERDGTISILAPKDLSEEKLQEAIQQKEYLIYKYLAEWEQLNASRIEREFVNGQSFMYLGRNYRLNLVDDNQTQPLLLKDGRFCLRKKDQSEGNKHFIEFYKNKGLPRLKTLIEKYKGRMGVQPNDIRIMELQNRWASCSTKGNLNFHWKSIMAPISVLEYIVVHELAHLIHMNHSTAFWNEIDKVLPRYQKSIEWLREHGASMDL